MNRSHGILVAVLLLQALNAQGQATFWLSTGSVGSPGPEAPSLAPTVGGTTTLYLWGRPAAGRQFDAISLDVIASATGLDFVDGTFSFFNAIDGSTDRFEYTADSTTVPSVTSFATAGDILTFGDIDDLIGLRGFTVTDTAAERGPGPYCLTGEVGCEVAGDGAPAWLIASFDVAAISARTVDLYLQVGDRGVVERVLAPGDYDLDGTVTAADRTIWSGVFGQTTAIADGNADGIVDAGDYTLWRDHVGDTATLLTAADTTVRFGIDSMGGDEPAYNASTDKAVTLLGDDPDVTLTISTPASAVPEPATGLLTWLILLISSGTRSPTRRA